MSPLGAIFALGVAVWRGVRSPAGVVVLYRLAGRSAAYFVAWLAAILQLGVAVWRGV